MKPNESYEDFEKILKINPDTGLEFWLARDLQALLGYSEWRNFLKVIEKAKESYHNAGNDITDHFVKVNKKVEVGSTAKRVLPPIDFDPVLPI